MRVCFATTKTGSRRNAASGRFRDELERHAIDAIAQAGRRRTIFEDVAKMTAAAAAMHLVAHHAVAGIGVGFDGAGNRIVEARPPSTALELEFGGKQRLIAGGAMEGPRALLVEERAASRHLRAVLSHDLVLLGRENLAPLGFAVGNWILFHHSVPI